MKNGLIIDDNGNKLYYMNDKLHCADEPAVKLINGSYSWWLNDELHNTSGPAIVWSFGKKEWFFHNVQLLHPEEFKSMEEFFTKLNTNEEYSLPWIYKNKYLINFINNPTDKQKRLHNMKWKI